MGIIYLLFSGEQKELEKTKNEDGEPHTFEVFTPTFDFFITRMICAILLISYLFTHATRRRGA